jgi:ATP-dependent Clp protease adaptor protein ClpS
MTIKKTPIGQSDEMGESGVATADRVKVQRPKRYKVLLHNDDYTTMEFVVFILKNVFGKTNEEAHGVMLEVHTKGIGVCGVYTFEVAETKASKVVKLARENGHPLKCTLESEL